MVPFLRSWLSPSSIDPAAGTEGVHNYERRQGNAKEENRQRTADDIRGSALVEQIRHDDTTALEALMRAHTPKLVALAYSITISRDQSYEIVQDVFIRVWDGREGLDPERSIGAYLWHMTRNRAISVMRRERSHARMVGTLAQRDMARSDTNAGDIHIQEEELLAEIEQVLETLPSRVREIFLLKWRFGLEVAEIASRLGVTESTVRSQLSRAVRRLADHFER